MNLKFLISFVSVFALVSCGLASPTPRFRRDVSEENLLPKDVIAVKKSISINGEKIMEEVGKSVKSLVENSQWIYKSLASIARTMVQEGFQNVASWMADFILRVEFLSMADGWHVYFPLNGKSEIEKEYKTVAKAVSKLLMNLKTMERTDMIVKNVTRYLVTKDADPHFQELKAAPEKMVRTFLHTFFETLDHRMEADEHLQAEYKQRKTEAREEVKRDPKMQGDLFKLWDCHSPMVTDRELEKFWEETKTLRQGIVNKLFLKFSGKHFMMIFSAKHHRRYLLSRALIQKAHSVSNSDSKINEIYHQALVQAAELLLDYKFDDKIPDVVFLSIENALESDPALNAEIQNMMKFVIEGSTVYDTDMFYEDFNVL